MQLLVALDQAQMPIQPFQLHAGRRQPIKAHAAIDRTDHRIHPLVTKHPPEVGLVVRQFQVFIQFHLQHRVHRLIEQAALNGVVVVLQEHFHRFLRVLILLQGEVDQQLQFQDGQLAPGGVVVELDADQGGDVGVIVQFAFHQAFGQRLEFSVIQAMQVEDIGAEKQGFVGVVPDQVVHRIDFRVVRHQDAAGGGAQVLIHRHVRFLAHVFENAEQCRGFFGVGVFALAGEVPLDEFVIRLGTEEAPRDHTAGVDKVLDEVIRFGHRVAFEGRLRQVVEAFETAALQQFSEAAFQRHFQARVRAKRGKHTTGTRVHQGHAHHREFTAQRGILDQHREALGFQPLDTGQNTRVLGQYFSRHIRQGEFAFDDFALDRPLEDLRQALHLGFGQGVAGAHAVAQVQVFDQVGREIHHLAVRLAHKRQRDNPALFIAGVGVEQVRAAQLAIAVVDFQAISIEDFRRQLILGPRLKPALVRVMHERRVGQFFAPKLIVIEEVAVETLDELAQRRGQRAFLGRALAVGEAHRRMGITDMQRPHVRHDIAPRGDLDLHAQAGQDAGHVGDGLLQRQVLAHDVGAGLRSGVGHQQRLGIGVEVFHLFDHELRPGLHHFLHGATVDRAQDALAILVGDIRRQFHLDLENLVVAIFWIDNVVLRQPDVFRGDIARLAVQLHKVRRTQCRRSQEVIEWPRRRPIAFIANRLIGDHREVIELGFKSKIVEKVNLNFHAGLPK